LHSQSLDGSERGLDFRSCCIALHLGARDDIHGGFVMVQPEYNLYGRQTTTHPGAHLLIINGPIRHELDVNCKHNVFGQGWRANATMGRALRLILINIAGNKPGVTDMATHGHPGKYSYCMGEDEEGSPWSKRIVGASFDPVSR
jgi:hypothetical protein